jgi:predicted RND superfamily exporter protein
VISGGVILGIICMLVPQPRIAMLVSLVIILSLVELVGIMYFWDVTINGVSTIYIMICVGLAVDYSAHIAHCFKESLAGSSVERAMEALTRIGPSVFHAVFSTLLAVAVVGFSKSYIFRVFFKVLFVVTAVAGAHGLVLLPTLLALFGGSNIAGKSVCGTPVGPSSDDVEAAGQQQGPGDAAGITKAKDLSPGGVHVEQKMIGA